MNRLLVWRCIHCTYDNDTAVNICAACSRTRSMADGYHGNGSGTADALKKQQKRMRHRKLEVPRRPELPRSDSETSVSSGSSLGSQSCSSLSCSSTWLCSKCFLENNLSQKVCVSCSTERKNLSNFPHNLLNHRDKHSKEDYMGKKNCQLKPLSFSTSLPPLTTSPSIWICDSCCQQNSVILAHCMLCNAAQSDTPKSDTPKSDTPKSDTPKTKSDTSHEPTEHGKPRHIPAPTNVVKKARKTRLSNQSQPPSPLSHNSHQDFSSRTQTKDKTTITNGCYGDDTSDTYQDIVKYFRKLRTNFVDDSFRPCNASIYGEGGCAEEGAADPHGNSAGGPHGNSEITWRRPHELDTGSANSAIKWTLFRTPLPTDIIQGSLGDCWLLSSLSVLADMPSLIEKIFLNKTVCTEGVYQVRLCKDGVWTNIIVDDYFPCYSSRKLMFAQSDRKQLWVPLIEKAVAKLFGSYHNLKAGHCGEGLQLLTGAPIESVKMSDYQEDLELLWGMLLSYKEAGYPIGVCCMGEEEQASRLGLTTRHAYSLLNLYGKEHLRLIQLRNPWAKDTWLGRYNNKCPSWTEQLRSELMVFEDSVEAMFWIELTDFVKYFTTMDICRLHQGWKEWRLRGVLPSHTSHNTKITYISVCETTSIDISLIQPSSRGNQEHIVDLSLAVLRCSDDSRPQSLIEYSGRSLLSNITCSTLISPGTYMIVPMAFLHLAPESDREPGYVLACFVDKASCVWQGVGEADVLADVLYKVTLAKGQHRDALQGCSVYQLNKKVAGLIMAVENRNPHRYFHISCDNHSTNNVVSTRGQITTSDWIPPLSRMIIMILTQLDETCGFKIQSSYKFSLTDYQEEEAAHIPPITDSLHKVFPL